jgi:excisionase family DNA binding protein
MGSSKNSVEPVSTSVSSVRPLLVNVPQAMLMLCLSRTTLYELIWQGVLTPVRIGRSVRFPIEQIEQFVRDRIAAST